MRVLQGANGQQKTQQQQQQQQQQQLQEQLRKHETSPLG
jgi:hypothetical protein